MNSNNKIAIIICYFGKLPDYFNSFLISCNNNPSYQWIIVTDDICDYRIPTNVILKNLSLDEVRLRIKQRIGEWAELNKPYKLCDYKPAYGLIFQDYLKDYTHWGYGDIDVVYGRLDKFISSDMLEEYDKIYPFGHFSILKNNVTCRQAFMLQAENTSDYRDVFSKSSSFFFDEHRGINEKMKAHGLKVYGSIDFLDLAILYSRLRLIDRKLLKLVFSDGNYTDIDYPPNYNLQCFALKNKQLLHVYWAKNRVLEKEYSYLHIRRRLNVRLDNNDCDFIIGKECIEELKKAITKDTIKNYNKKSIPDNVYYYRYVISRRIKYVKKRLKNGLKKLIN